MTRAQRTVLDALVFVGLAAATYVAVTRVMIEQTNATVALAIDFGEVEELAGSKGMTPTAVLKALHSAGATHLALAEDTLQGLLSRGEAWVFSAGATSEVWLDTRDRLDQVTSALTAKLPGDYGKIEDEEGWRVIIASPVISMLNMGLGYPRDALKAAQEAGLGLVARPHWQGIRTSRAVAGSVTLAEQAGARLVVFTGDQVVGHPNLIDATASALEHNQMTFGLVELAPQNGANGLAVALSYRVVRVHSITEPEMRIISPGRAVDRFIRAARERNVRLLYCRLLPGAEASPLQTNVRYVSAIRDGLRAQGLRTGAPRAFASLHTPEWLLALVLVGAWGGLLWLAQALLGLAPRHFWPLTVVVLVGGSAGAFVATSLTRSVGALAAAIVFPLLGVAYAARAAMTERAGLSGLPRAFGPVLAAFLKVSIYSALGGLLVVGLLGESSYLMKVAQFRGVKLAQLLPLLGVALLWLARSTPAYRRLTARTGPSLVDFRSGISQPEWPALWRGLRQAFGQIVVYWHVAAALVGLVVVALLLMRSGNEPGVGVLPVELQFRALLDKILVVRPRTKEVFLGHPLMMLTLLLALRGVRRWLWVGFGLGAIGQISLVNSFCHIHTPLLVTLMRVFNGLWVGALVGIVLCILWDAGKRQVMGNGG